MSFLRWSKRPSRMDVGCVAEPYDEQTEQAQKDLLVVVEYLAERTSGVGASGEDITQAAHICSPPFHSLTEPQRVEVWQFLNRLCRLIAPATVEGLRAARHKHTSRYGWSALFLGVVVTFILAILLQAYALFGTQTLNRLKTPCSKDGKHLIKVTDYLMSLLPKWAHIHSTEDLNTTNALIPLVHTCAEITENSLTSKL